jgi:hypothetical protein
VRLPGSMSTEFVESVRDRKGGMLSLQFKPNQDLDVTMTGFHSDEGEQLWPPEGRRDLQHAAR